MPIVGWIVILVIFTFFLIVLFVFSWLNSTPREKPAEPKEEKKKVEQSNNDMFHYCPECKLKTTYYIDSCSITAPRLQPCPFCDLPMVVKRGSMDKVISSMKEKGPVEPKEDVLTDGGFPKLLPIVEHEPQKQEGFPGILPMNGNVVKRTD